MITEAEFLNNLNTIKKRIVSTGRDPNEIKIVAVCKNVSVQEINFALKHGISDVGENYAQPLLSKINELGKDNISWHYLGTIQTNKISKLAKYVNFFQAVTRKVEIDKLVHYPVNGFVEINVKGDKSKQGVSLKQADELVGYAAQTGFGLNGVMVVGMKDDKLTTRKIFKEAARFASYHNLKFISAGMTDDLEIALEEGSNMIRIGRGLFSLNNA